MESKQMTEEIEKEIERFESGKRPSGADSGDAQLYSKAACLYDRINLSVSFGNGYSYRREEISALDIAPGARVLDIGSGTGILARAAMDSTGSTGRVVALDPCREMLEIARASGVRETVVGSVDDIPFEDETFDVVTAGYSLRYARKIEHGLAQIRSVLKPGGRVLILEITPPRNPVLRALTRAYILVGARAIALLATRSLTSQRLLGHLWNEIRTTPQPKEFTETLRAAGFDRCTCRRKYGMLTAYTAVKSSDS